MSSSFKAKFFIGLALIVCSPIIIHGQPAAATERTARHFDSIRNSPPQLLAFLLEMPKGGDLHNHL